MHEASPIKQMIKVREEIGELSEAITEHYSAWEGISSEDFNYHDHKRIEKTKAEVVDGIGDSFVTLIILSQQLSLSVTDCLAAAYEEIKDREGQMIDGVFIKDGDTRCIGCLKKKETKKTEIGWLCENCIEQVKKNMR